MPLLVPYLRLVRSREDDGGPPEMPPFAVHADGVHRLSQQPGIARSVFRIGLNESPARLSQGSIPGYRGSSLGRIRRH